MMRRLIIAFALLAIPLVVASAEASDRQKAALGDIIAFGEAFHTKSILKPIRTTVERQRSNNSGKLVSYYSVTYQDGSAQHMRSRDDLNGPLDLKLSNKSVRLPHNIKIGVDSKEIVRVLGPPKPDTDSSLLVYQSEINEIFEDVVYFRVDGTGQLVEIEWSFNRYD